MIDTDKYEGHTEGPWELITNYSEEDWDNKWAGSVHLFTTLGISFDVVGVNETDVQLMADAPKLLAEVKRLQALIRSKGLCTNCGQSHEGIEVVMDYSEDEVGHRISKECVDTCHPNLSIHCCDLCLCLNGFTIEHDYWEAKKND